MSSPQENDRMNELRKRLYERGNTEFTAERHDLTGSDATGVSREWQVEEKTAQSTPPAAKTPKPAAAVRTDFIPAEEQPKRHYRSFILIGSLLIFIFMAGVSSLYLYFGGNQISSDNIGIVLSGPPSIGGGEVMSLQVGVTNQNSVPIESATLVLKYPDGTRSVNESQRTLFEDRIPINGIGPGEVRNIPVRVAIFGEESQEKEITATIEYRIEGSNGMFFKEAVPLQFRISSSPLVLRIESFEKVASGQLVDLKIIAQSNASTPLTDILVSAQYPNGFDFESSTPAPVFGENVWRINELPPEESFEIDLKGVVAGLTEETFRINFNAGPAQSDNQYVVDSKLAEAWADFTIERPFIDIDITIDGSTDEVVTIPAGKKTGVQIGITNTLDETVYDMVVEVVPGGNALDQDSILTDQGVNQGFYDSNTGTIRWEVSNNPNFAQIFPGDTRTVGFQVDPSNTRATASFDLVVNVYARRVAESSALEQLIGTVRGEAKYSSEILVGSQAGHNTGVFESSGSIPPRVGQTTTYTMTMVAEAGANDITDAVVNTSIPTYVNWLNNIQGDGELVYNNVSKQIEWDAGNIGANRRKEVSFQVSILPSVSQIDTTPVLLNTQQMRANDRFTGVLLQSSAKAVTTELSAEAGHQKNNGRVIGN